MKIGRSVVFHGSFRSKQDAKKKERAVHGFIRATTIKGKRRFMVLTKKKGTRRANPPVAGIVARIPGKIEMINYQRPKNASPEPDRKGVRGNYVPYEHRFKPGAKMFALSDGSVIVKPPKGRKLFVLADKDGYAQ